MEYKIVTEDNLPSLQHIVNKHMGKGFFPVGGPSMGKKIVDNRDVGFDLYEVVIFFQAMVKKEERPRIANSHQLLCGAK